jgi:hypothetical protein
MKLRLLSILLLPVAASKFTTAGANDNVVPWAVGDAGYNTSNPFRNANAYYFIPDLNELTLIGMMGALRIRRR